MWAWETLTVLEERGFGATCGIFAAFHAVAPSEGAGRAGVIGRGLSLVKLVLLSLWNRKVNLLTPFPVSRWLLLWFEEFVEKSLLKVEIPGNPETEGASENRRQMYIRAEKRACRFLWSHLGLQKKGGNPFVCFNRRLPLCLINSR